MKFEWVLGEGISLPALERMKAHFLKPDDPPYEAWFMSGINYHTHFLEHEPSELDLEQYFFDTGGGIRNFGRYKEWVDWYHYFLPYVLQDHKTKRIHYLPLLIGYFVNLYSKGAIQEDSRISEKDQREYANADYPGGITETYAGFREDVLHALGQVIMEPFFWDGQEINPDSLWLGSYWEPGEWIDSFYSTLFFCLMYLTPDEMVLWVASIANLAGSSWRREVSVWLTGLRRFLYYYYADPNIIPIHEQRNKSTHNVIPISEYLEVAGIGWRDDFLVFTGLYASRNLHDYIPQANLEAFWREIEKYPNLIVGTVVDKKVYTIDGKHFATWEEFFAEIIRVLAPELTLDADGKTLHQILTGGVGSRGYDDFVLVWRNFDQSQEYFGDETTVVSLDALRRERSSRLDFMVKFLRKYPNVELRFE